MRTLINQYLNSHVLTKLSQWSTASTNRRIFSAAALIGFITFGVKLAGMMKEIVVASLFGTGDDLDAFLIAFLLPSFIVNVVCGSFNAAFIPTYIRVREQDGPIAAQKLFSSVLALSLALLAVATLLILLTVPYYLPLLASGFPNEKMYMTRKLLYLLSPIVIMSGVINISGALLNAGERFAIAAFTPVITSVAIIVFLVLGVKEIGIAALSLGMVCGILMEATLLIVVLKHKGVAFLPKWHGMDQSVRQVMGQYLPVLSGSLLMCSSALVDQSMAAMLGAGSVAALNYGNKIIAFPITLAATALGTAVVPYFSAMVVQRNWTEIRHTLKRYLSLIFGAAVPLTLILIMISEPLVKMIYQRGSFSGEDTHLVARIQVLFALQIPFYVAGILIVRLISSFNANVILMWGALISVFLNIILNYFFMQWLGVSGIAVSTSIVYFVSFCYLGYMLMRLIRVASYEG